MEDDAALGVLLPASQVKYQEFINSPNWDIYSTEGYRMATVAEVLSFIDLYTYNMYVGWHSENLSIDARTDAIYLPGYRKPLKVQGHSFYDILAPRFPWSTHDTCIRLEGLPHRLELGYSNLIKDAQIVDPQIHPDTFVSQTYSIGYEGICHDYTRKIDRFRRVDITYLPSIDADLDYHAIRPVRTIHP